MKLKGRVVIVTGGGTGIGRGISGQFGAEGALVVVNYASSKDASEETAAAIRSAGGDAIAFQTDVTNEAAVKAMFVEVERRYGRIDVLVNNAGWSKRTPHAQLDDLTEEIWDRTLNTNLRAPFYCMRAAAPYLRKQAGASIVNISSIAPYSGQGSSIVYAASKAGLISMTKSFARVLAPEIRVNAIAPGFVRTRFAGWPQEAFDEAEKTSPLRRIASPEELGAAAVFLAADATAMTGETINVDVGQTAIGRIV
ncbi:MAG: SDR family oxidoreductase [Candidatus Solibacter usitatus]|nr:SDR family oxidoreductase [Candidatus Solibacter usitatus]